MQVNNTVLAHVESSRRTAAGTAVKTPCRAHAHLPAEAYGRWCLSRLSGEALTALNFV